MSVLSGCTATGLQTRARAREININPFGSRSVIMHFQQSKVPQTTATAMTCYVRYTKSVDITVII